MDSKIDFQKMQGLVPAIVQDGENEQVLMLGFMNEEAYERTLAGGYVTFFSRTRNELWTKGETSGNRLKVLSMATDCDHDTLFDKSRVEGKGVVCHRGTRSCFHRSTDSSLPTWLPKLKRCNDEVAAGNSRRQFAGSNLTAFRACGFARIHKRAFLLRLHG